MNNYGYYSDNSLNRMNYNEFFNTMGLNNLNDDLDYNVNTNMNLNDLKKQNNSNLFGSYEGYIKGNMFRDLYSQYKDYKPTKLVPRSEEDEILLNLNQMHFAMHEVILYLDVNPDDQNMMIEYIKLRDSYNKLLDQYQKRYFAVEYNDGNLNKVPFGWEEEKFPWDRRKI